MKKFDCQELFDRDLEIVEKFHPGYKENLLNLAKGEISLATKKLREDSGYPMMDCKIYITKMLKEQNDFQHTNTNQN